MNQSNVCISHEENMMAEWKFYVIDNFKNDSTTHHIHYSFILVSWTRCHNEAAIYIIILYHDSHHWLKANMMKLVFRGTTKNKQNSNPVINIATFNMINTHGSH